MDLSGVLTTLHNCFKALTLDTIKKELSIHENSITSIEEPPKPKKIIRRIVKKATPQLQKRCDARIYGEALYIEGTKAPNGTPYKVYRPVQCDKNATSAISLDGDDEGELYLCKVCETRYKTRLQNPAVWHGFFDGDVPETSHFVNGSWHRKKVEKIESADAVMT
jgi:hypothetical protein